MIDFHMHAFPDPLAERALVTLSEKNGGVMPYTDGTLAGLFGSDSPWSDPANEIRFIEHLELSTAAKEAIFDTNARKLLGIR